MPYFMRWDLVFAKTAGAAGSQTCRRFCGTLMEKRRKGRSCRPFVKATARRLCRCFCGTSTARRRSNLRAVSMARRMGRYFIGTIVPDAEDTCGWHPWEGDGEGLRDFFSEHTPCPGAEHTKQTEGRGIWVVFRSVFAFLYCCIGFARPYGMPGMLRGKA